MLFVNDPKQSGSAAQGKRGSPAGPGGQPPEPGRQPPKPGRQPPKPGRQPPKPGGLASRLGKVEEQLAEFHRRAAHREAVIDRLHEQNQRLSEGLGRAYLEPVIADLIRLYDQLNREVRRLEASGQDGKLLGSFADEVVQILDRCGVEAFTAEPGDPLERGRHRALAVVACDDESWHNTLAEVVTAGFADRETGRIRRPVQARVFQYSAAPGAAGQAPSTARSL
jgi:molecular chaperone GrpE